MNEMDQIRDEIERAFDGDPWCGPSLTSVLHGIPSDLAARRAPVISHSTLGDCRPRLGVAGGGCPSGRRGAGRDA